MALITLPGPVGDFATGTTYQTGDIVRGPDSSWMSQIDDNTAALPTGGASDASWQLIAADGTASAGGVTVEDEGTALTGVGTILNFTGAGVTATGNGSTKTIEIPGSGVNPPTPTEHFTFSLADTDGNASEPQGTNTETVTATLGTTGNGFTYNGYTNARVIGPGGELSVSAVMGTGTTFTAMISTIQTGTYRFTADILSNDANSNALPNHSVSANYVIAPSWRRLQADAQPAAFPQLGDEAAWTGSDTVTLTKATMNSNIYFALPTRNSGGYIFKSGVLFLSQVLLATIGSDHTLYTIPDFNGLAVGQTLTIDITEG